MPLPSSRSFALLSLLLMACQAVAPPDVRLDGSGGDAWSFSRRLSGSIVAGACDEVWLAAERVRVRAELDDDRFAAALPLVEGDNEVRAICRQASGREWLSAPQRWRVRLRDVPRAEARVRVTQHGVLLDGASSRASEGSGAALVQWQWSLRPGNPEELVSADGRRLDELTAGEGRVLAAVPATDGEYFATLRVVDAAGRADESTVGFRVRDGVASVQRHRGPGFIDSAVVYGAVPILFGPRGLAGVTERLDGIAALGASVIWLSPVTDAPADDFGYAVTDHFRVNPRLGSLEELRALVEAAHARGLKVILDFVPNHTSAEHPYYLDALAKGPASPYHDFYERDEAGRVTHYFDWDHLPNLDYDNPEVRRFIIEAFTYWVRELDVDGFRVDVAWGVRRRAPEFWASWRQELVRIKPDLLLIAEAPARDPYYFRNGFDAAYDWTERPGQWAWRHVFDDPALTAARLREALAPGGPDDDALVLRFLGNNDTGARFITRFGRERVPVAAALLLTLPGLPCVYNGDEVGAQFDPYDEGPAIQWHDPHGLTPVYRRLIELRREREALRSRAWRIIDAGDERVLGYVRVAAEPRDSVLVLLNFAAEPVSVRVAIAALPEMAVAGELVDLLGGIDATPGPGGELRLQLETFQPVILGRAGQLPGPH